MTTFELDAVEGDPCRIGDAAAAWRHGDPPDLRMPTADGVRSGAATLSPDEARHLVEILAAYPAFVPPVDDDQRDELLMELLTASVDDVVPWELALALTGNGIERVRSFLERILRARVHVSHRDRMVTLLSFLLEGPDAGPVVRSVLTAAASADEVAGTIVEQLALDREVEWP